MSPPTDGAASRLDVAVRSRLLPLVLLLAVVVSISAPAASLMLGLGEQRARAAALSLEVARVLRQEVRQQPALWRYKVLRLRRQVELFTSRPGVLAVEVTGRDGQPVGLCRGEALAADDALDSVWASAPMAIINRSGARVWVAVSTTGVYRNALSLLAAFLALGVSLAALMYWIPMRALGRAELRMADQQRRREVSARAATTLEGERRAIARDLHDSAGQSLTALRLKLQLLEATAADDEHRELVLELIDLADETVEDIRRAVRSLGPAIVDELGLPRALERYAETFAERTGLEVEQHIEPPGRGLPRGLESACYRLAQEALNNAAKHSGAGAVSLRLERDGDWLLLQVADRGRGFDPAAESAGRGLAGMRERVELLGGTLELDAEPGRGARLAFSLPLPSPRQQGLEPEPDPGQDEDQVP